MSLDVSDVSKWAKGQYEKFDKEEQRLNIGRSQRVEPQYPMWNIRTQPSTGTFRIPLVFGSSSYFYTTAGSTTTIRPMEDLMECNKMKPYLFCIIKHPTTKQAEDGIGAFLVHKMDILLARDEDQAHVLAGRHIKEEDMGATDRIEVVVRPF